MEDAILTVTCREHKGVHERSVYPLIFTGESLKRFWEESNKFPVLFGHNNVTLEEFQERFFTANEGQVWPRGLHWIIDDWVGMFYLTDIYETEADAHFTFFDKKLEGREELTRKIIEHVFKEFFTFQRLNVSIPCYVNSKVFKFVRDVGFRAEGRKRNCALYKGKWFDSIQFGLLRGELNGH